jgi:hypothetical protein
MSEVVLGTAPIAKRTFAEEGGSFERGSAPFIRSSLSSFQTLG